MKSSFLLKSLSVTYFFAAYSSITYVYLSHCSTVVSACFSNDFLRDEHVNLTCFVTLLWSKGNISSQVRYLYVPILPDYNAAIFAASWSMSYYVLY